MKKIIAILMACLLMLSFTNALAQSEKALRIVCTTFPQYDWVRRILGERVNDVDLTLLLDNGVDLHSFQPTADDIIKIAQSDLFVYVGGESDGWVGDVLATVQNPNLKTVNMLESVEAKEEETVEGMQEEHDEDEDDHDSEIEYDEHVWLSLRNAETKRTATNTMQRTQARMRCFFKGFMFVTSLLFYSLQFLQRPSRTVFSMSKDTFASHCNKRAIASETPVSRCISAWHFSHRICRCVAHLCASWY